MKVVKFALGICFIVVAWWVIFWIGRLFLTFSGFFGLFGIEAIFYAVVLVSYLTTCLFWGRYVIQEWVFGAFRSRNHDGGMRSATSYISRKALQKFGFGKGGASTD